MLVESSQIAASKSSSNTSRKLIAVLMLCLFAGVAAAQQYAWLGGSSTGGAARFGIYGTKGVASSSNAPGSRVPGGTWKDSAGNLWLFGGYGYGSSGEGYLQDLWKYDTVSGNWTWLKGVNTVNELGVHGTQGVAAAANSPGTRQDSTTWVDASGNLWLFGGEGFPGGFGGFNGPLNDLWKYNPSTNNWTWMKGSVTTHASGTYGTQNVAAAANTPGARQGATGWIDASGNLWLFGGDGEGATSSGRLNDLWKYDPISNNWTWIKGSTSPTQSGTYGTINVAAVGNTPGSRSDAGGWIDASGNLWLFGGFGNDSAGSFGFLNDVWKFVPGTGNWTWIKGSNLEDSLGTFGTQGVAAAGNNPSGREAPVTVKDSTGAFWLFGGYGYGSTTAYGRLNDVWKFDTATTNWTWMDGSNIAGAFGVYGTQGVPNAANTPGGRSLTAGWADASGNLWVFGGAGQGQYSFTTLNDLWKYNPGTGNWTWIKGSTGSGELGVFGTQGVAAVGNVPSARENGAMCADPSGNIWLFGGRGYASNGYGLLNDLWKYSPSTNMWTWMKGSNSASSLGTYGTQGVEAPGNIPGARADLVSWADASGSIWIFGGYGYDATGPLENQSDLWKYNPATNNWTWMKGSNVGDASGIYGSIGVEAPGNLPGARNDAVAFRDNSGNLWLFGGSGHANTSGGALNDLWRYKISTNNWTWMKGSNEAFINGSYGTLGVAAPSNTPGPRLAASGWTDQSGMLWLFGGLSYGVTLSGWLSDIWQYNPGTGNWTWMDGPNTDDASGDYGTLGVPSSTNSPGGRTGATTFSGITNQLWLIGGRGYSSEPFNPDRENDTWKYDLGTGNWTWIAGSEFTLAPGTYGTQGVAAASNTPGAREDGMAVRTSSGAMYLFGGFGYSAGGYGEQNDFWLLSIQTKADDWALYE